MAQIFVSESRTPSSLYFLALNDLSVFQIILFSLFVCILFKVTLFLFF